MSKLIFLGTSGAVGSKERDNTSLLFSHKDRKILIDCPGSIVSKLEKVGVDFKEISTIFFTHAHPDHLYGIISLLHSQYRLNNKINIYTHKNVIKKIRKLRVLFGLDNEEKFPSLCFNNFSDNSEIIFEKSNTTVKSFKVKHKPESLGFKFVFSKNNKEIIYVYTGDTAKHKNTIKIAKGSDFLIHDCFGPQRFFEQYPELEKMHTSSYDLGVIADKSKTRNLIPIHFAQEVEYSISTVKKEIKQNFDGNLQIPEDLEEIKF